jgi:hypothetical protein
MTEQQLQELDDLRRAVSDLRSEVNTLHMRANHHEDRIIEIHQWVETVCSWPWKRLWWVLCGFRLYQLGRWRRPIPWSRMRDALRPRS